jgi:hypothetical protein
MPENNEYWRHVFACWPLLLIDSTRDDRGVADDRDVRYWIGLAAFFVEIGIPTTLASAFIFGFSPWWTALPIAMHCAPPMFMFVGAKLTAFAMWLATDESD